MPFVTLYWMPDRARAKKLKCASAGGWDTHGNNFQCLREMLLPEFDRCFSALLEDLVDRGCWIPRWCLSPVKWDASRRSGPTVGRFFRGRPGPLDLLPHRLACRRGNPGRPDLWHQ
ncbi:MAG: hypothetical protein CM1200mP2_27110 [Planctomycetaceae bacterium]|nr:MAG: hypothetical protein CM1200mP2_27110 [Planctomycetaceae bacterium]